MRALVLAFLFALTACDGPADDREDVQTLDEDTENAHVHHAKRGGRLIEIGAHMATIEIVHDREAGTLTAFIMDGHASNPVRLDASAIPVTLTVAGEDLLLDLKPVASTLTGETIGDTSQFEATAEVLKRITKFRGSIGKVSIYDEDFTDVAFTYAAKSAD